MTPGANDHNDEEVVTLRDIYNVVMQTSVTVARMDERVKDLEKLPQDIEKVSDRVSLLERGHSRMIGIAFGGATVTATAVTIIGWTIGK